MYILEELAVVFETRCQGVNCCFRANVAKGEHCAITVEERKGNVNEMFLKTFYGLFGYIFSLRRAAKQAR
jgi:hypothetical protein